VFEGDCVELNRSTMRPDVYDAVSTLDPCIKQTVAFCASRVPARVLSALGCLSVPPKENDKVRQSAVKTDVNHPVNEHCNRAPRR
jgi:hypothetical protein